jgi:hypothetical protein
MLPLWTVGPVGGGLAGARGVRPQDMARHGRNEPAPWGQKSRCRAVSRLTLAGRSGVEVVFVVAEEPLGEESQPRVEQVGMLARRLQLASPVGGQDWDDAGG